MVEVGSMSIGGRLATDRIMAGLSRVRGGFDRVKGSVASANVDLERVAAASKDIGSSLLKVGTAGVAALTGLATASPAVAPSLAKMKVGMMELSHTAGRVLRPVFEAVANDLIPAIGTALEKNSGKISRFADITATMVSDVGNLLAGENEKIKNPASKSLLAVLGGVLGGSFGGPKGAVIGSGLSLYVYHYLVPQDTGGYSGPFKETQQSSDDLINFAKQQWANPSMNPLVNTRASAQGAFLAFRSGFNAVIDSIEWVYANSDRKDREMSSPAGVTR